jgi:hypothetical protein
VTEKVVNDELGKLTKRPPRTQAEKNFHAWLLEWKDILDKARNSRGLVENR